MKRSIMYRTMISLVIILITSCSEDFLDLKPVGSLNSATFFTSETDVVEAVNGVYQGMRGVLGGLIIMSELRSDNSTVHYDKGLRAGGNPEREGIDEIRDFSDNFIVGSFWNNTYHWIYRANTVLARIDEAVFDETLKARLGAECKFIRAFHYFNLVRLFGDVPLLLLPERDISGAYGIGRSAASEVYTQIIQDVEDAVSILPITYDNTTNWEKGRITKGAALTLLGKVYLTQKKYSEAKAALEEVATLGYALESNFADCFKNKGGVESIFEFQYSVAASQSVLPVIQPWVPRGIGTGSAWDVLTGLSGGNEYSWNLPTKDFMSAIEPGDNRKDVIFKFVTATVDGALIDVQYFNKWIPYLGESNFQVYRYADVLLMLAEIYNEQGDAGNAKDKLNQIRTRAGLANTTANTQAEIRLAIEKERRVELSSEGHRWFDLLRTDRAMDVMTAHGAIEKADPSVLRNPPYSANAFDVQSFRLLYPIPNAEVLKNPSVLTQNPGY